MCSRRLEAKARTGASFLRAAMGETRSTHIADLTQLNITARNGLWRASLDEVFAIINDALKAPPSEAATARALAPVATAATPSPPAPPPRHPHPCAPPLHPPPPPH